MKTKTPILQKTFLTLLACIVASINSFAQFGGGSGTEEDPYQIWNKSNWDEFATEFNSHNEDSFGDFTGIHLRLMNNITDTLKIMPSLCIEGPDVYFFNGSFHGGGHLINIYPDSTEYNTVFGNIGESGYLDSLRIVGSPYYFTSLLMENCGLVYNCICDVDINPPLVPGYFRAGICYLNTGILDHCINLTDFSNAIHPATQEYDVNHLAGIAMYNHGIVRHCINMGTISAKDVYLASGIINFTEFSSITEHCINYGNISVSNTSSQWIGDFGGIAGWVQDYSVVQNCINMGNINFVSEMPGGGICGIVYPNNNTIPIVNCLNIGKVEGLITFNNQNTHGGGGILGRYESTVQNNNCSNCLNVGNAAGSAIADTITYENTLLATNNYYDKQMCLSKGIAGEDISGSAEGKLTTQLTGTSPELQAMLGNGWSYAEGRYPIPLGLENDSMALVAATPVYLHFTTEEAYNHVDSVSKNFTVGLENDIIWEETSERVSFNDENVTLLSIGAETLTVSLGDYNKKVRITIVDTEVSIPQQNMYNRINLYPNPTFDNINIDLNGIKADKIEIHDITGKLLSTYNLSSEQIQFFTGNLNAGLYLLKVYDGNQNIASIKFTKK
jgi:hypothetical protein